MQLNYDIIAIIIIVFSIIFAYARGFFKQIKITLAIITPFLIIIFAKNFIDQIISNLSAIDGILLKIANILAFFTNITSDDLKLLIVYLAIFIVSSLVIRTIVNLFSLSKKKKVVTFKSKASQIIAAVLGLVRGLALVIVTLFLLKEITIINFTSPLTSTLVNVISPFFGDFTV